MANKNLYTKDSIESLTPLQFTRLKPGVYAGDTTYATQLLVEIISNAVDEFRAGNATEIAVTIDGAKCSVVDNGQGFIYSMREDGKSILEAAFSILNTSGKYSEDGVYEGTSLGAFGIGSKITNFLSHDCYVQSTRDGNMESISFVEGEFSNREVTDVDKKLHGTSVHWTASEEFFTHPEVEIKKVKELFETIVCLCPGLTIKLWDNISTDNDPVIYYSKNGISDLVDKMAKKELLNNRFITNRKSNKLELDLVLTYTKDYSSSIIPYVNIGLTDTGPHITQLKTAITREFNKFFKEKKWLKEKEENLSGSDIQEGMLVVFNYTAPNVGYDSQVKSRVVKVDTSLITEVINDDFRAWLVTNEKEIKDIFDKAYRARKAREAARKAREAVRDKGSKKKKLLDLPTKLVDANSKNRQECELYICEGDSAAGGLIEVRDSETVAVFPIRGKMINLYKNSIEKVLANQEVNNLKKALGLDIDIKTGKLKYDISKLRYGKILTACDADPDGQAIKNLILTCLWTICPELILNGHVYITIPPLYRITKGKDNYIYLKDDTELEEYKKTHQNEKYVINRNKGLGEQDSSELEPCLLNKETRNVAQIIVPNYEEAEELFEILMGKNVPPRREWLLDHSEEAGDNLW